MDDYKNLEGEKKRAILAVILSGIIMGIIYTLVALLYDNNEDSLHVHKTLKHSSLK